MWRAAVPLSTEPTEPRQPAIVRAAWRSCAIPAVRLAETVEALRRDAETERTVAACAAADAARFAGPER